MVRTVVGTGTKKIKEAPIDGSEYVRKNGVWSVNTGGGGVGYLDGRVQ